MYVPRALTTTFNTARSQFPAVLVTGPRQSGKSTFLRHAAPKARYVTFDDPQQRAFAREDPRGLLAMEDNDRPIVLDEIQYVPELLSYIKMAIDEDRAPGRFLLSGSQQFELMRGVTESLAGRVALLELLPFSRAEESSATPTITDEVWRGGFPDPRLHPEMRDLWLTSYIRTYIERDVRAVRNIQDLATFEQFLCLAAARYGQEFAKADLARACGVSQPTIASWVSVLSASYVTWPLPPWHRNLGKRLIKRPKLYFLDSALVCALTAQPSPEAAMAGPMRGAFFEGWVVSEARKAFAAAGLPPRCYFWRSHGGLEVDLLLEIAGHVVPVEIKATATPKAGHARPLQRFVELAGGIATSPLLVCDVRETTHMPHGVAAVPWRAWPQLVASLVADGV